MENHEVLRKYFSVYNVMQLLMIPTLSVMNLATCSSQILRLVNGQLEGLRVYLPFYHFQIRSFLESLRCELTGVVISAITNRIRGDYLYNFGGRQYFPFLLIVDEDRFDVMRQFLLFENGLNVIKVHII